MKKNNNTNLLTEVNLIREMMGLTPKNLILENIGLTLIKAFASSATKFAKMSANELATELGAVARSAKSMFDDLARAVTTNDETFLKATITNITNTLDNTALTRLADDLLIDTGELAKSIDRRVKALLGRNVSDDFIKKQIKDDLDNLLIDAPDKLKNTIKTQAENVVEATIKSVKGSTQVGTIITADDVFTLLGQNPIWGKFRTKFPELMSDFENKINILIDAGAKTAKEVEDVIIKQAISKLKGSTWTNIKAIMIKNPKMTKIGLIIIGLTVITYGAGKVGYLNKVGMWLCDTFLGQTSETCQEFRAELEQAEEDLKQGKTNTTTTTGGCGKTLDDFKAWVTSEGMDAASSTWDENSCTGTVEGVGFKYSDGSFGPA
jgi:hypothetical protein